jgi:hypothetical protein
MSWLTQRRRGFQCNIQNWGITIILGSIEINAIGPPQEQIKQMTQGPNIMERPAQFEISRLDYIAHGIRNKSRFQFTPKDVPITFEVYSIVDDPADEGVKLNCVVRQ